MKIIAHVDADCFYVSCERIRDKSLIGIPVAVLGNQGACVIARSYEMKKFGVKVGMPVWEAKNVCPDAVYVKRDFEWYGEVSYKMREIFLSYSDVVEFYSIDESFIDFGDYSGDLCKLARKIQSEIYHELDMPVSVGISLSRTLAKIGSDKNKPFGVTVVDKSNLEEFLKNTSVGEVCGIGYKLEARLKQMHIDTCFDYVSRPAKFIKSLLHKPGEEIWYELQGKALLLIKNERPQRKMISRGGSLWGYHKDPKYVFGFLVRNLERFCESLLSEKVEIKNFVLVLIDKEGFEYKFSDEMSDFTQDFNIILNSLKHGFRKIFKVGKLYGYCHLIGFPVRSVCGKQLNFFEYGDERRSKIHDLKQQVNSHFGLFTLRSASTAYASTVFGDKTSDYEITDIKGKLCF